MLIYVDLTQFRKHLGIVDQQLAQERRNAELLRQWRTDAAMDPGTDFELIERQIRFVERQIQNTRKKQDYLENLAADMFRVKRQMGEKITSAEEALKQLE